MELFLVSNVLEATTLVLRLVTSSLSFLFMFVWISCAIQWNGIPSLNLSIQDRFCLDTLVNAVSRVLVYYLEPACIL